MYLTCKCLNVSVRTLGEELKAFERSEEVQPEIEKQDEFFQEPLAMAIKLEGINKEQAALLTSRNVGSWVISRCINCSTYTHAVHRVHGAARVLINTKLVSSSGEISRLKADPRYSATFRIVVYENVFGDDEIPTKYSAASLPSNLQQALTSLQQQLEQAVQKKAGEIEEIIRSFTAEQYQRLEEFREQVHLEHHVLARIVCAGATSPKAPEASEPPRKPLERGFTTPNEEIHAQIKNSDSGFVPAMDFAHEVPLKAAGIIGADCAAGKKLKKSKSLGKDDNADAEALFALEGMDDEVSEQLEASQDEEDDTDDSGQDEGIHIPRGERGSHPTIAKSLPVTVPNFSRYVSIAARDCNGPQRSIDPLDPHNIRASIKALAKSIHGDAVFGDLPRPRFSTQI